MFKLFATICVAGAATAASAITWTSPLPGMDQGPLASETTLVDFATRMTLAATAAGAAVVTGTTPGFAAAPLGKTGSYLAIDGSFTFDASALGRAFQSFSFYWGSVDAGNTVQVFDLAGNTLLTMTGAALPRSDGSQSSPAANRRVFYSLGAGETLGSVRFSYDGRAFEIADLAFASAVPEPATWVLMIAGFALAGGVLRRQGALARAA